jgi:hypothetical protein
MGRPRKYKAGTYLTDGKRLIYVLSRDAEQPNRLLIEDVITDKSVVVGDADLAGYRVVEYQKEQPDESKEQA